MIHHFCSLFEELNIKVYRVTAISLTHDHKLKMYLKKKLNCEEKIKGTVDPVFLISIFTENIVPLSTFQFF